MDEEKKFTASDLRNIAQQLIRNGQMPKPEDFGKVMGEAREDYVPKLKKIREESGPTGG